MPVYPRLRVHLSCRGESTCRCRNINRLPFRWTAHEGALLNGTTRFLKVYLYEDGVYQNLQGLIYLIIFCTGGEMAILLFKRISLAYTLVLFFHIPGTLLFQHKLGLIPSSFHVPFIFQKVCRMVTRLLLSSLTASNPTFSYRVWEDWS